MNEGIGYGLRRGRARKIDDRGGAKRVDDVVAVSLSTVERTNGANGRQDVFGKIAVETADDGVENLLILDARHEHSRLSLIHI